MSRSNRQLAYILLGVVSFGTLTAFSQTAVAEGWQAAADVAPGAAATQPAGGPALPAAAAADPFRLKTGINLTSNSQGLSQIAVSTPTGRYLLLYGGLGYELWNLKAGAREKSGKASLSQRNAVLSPDGQYLAGIGFGPGGDTVEIYSTRTDKVAGQGSGKASPGSQSHVIGFCGTNRVAVSQISMTTRQMTVQFYAVTGGPPKDELTLANDRPSNSAALSATGKYLAVAAGGSVQLIETATAKLLGTSPLPKPDNGRSQAVGAASLGFSPDGNELAVAVVASGQGGLRLETAIFSATTGQLIEEKAAETAAAVGVGMDLANPARLTWSSNGSYLLFGKLMIDRKDLSSVKDIDPGDTGFGSEFLWADPATVLMVSRQGAGYASKDVKIDLTPGAVAGGPRGRSTVPPASSSGGATGGRSPAGPAANALETPADLGQRITFDADATAPWNIVPGDLPAPKPVLATISVRRPTKFPAGAADRLSGIFYSDRASNTVVVEHGSEKAVGRGAARGNAQADHNYIERYDLTTGAPTASIEVDTADVTLDVAPSGNVILVRIGSESNEVASYTYDKPTFHDGGAWTPFGKTDPNRIAARIEMDANAVEWGGMVDDSHALLLSHGGTLIFADMSAKKVIWSIPQEAARLFGAAGTGVPALSPDRKLAAGGTAKGVALFDPTSGKTLNFIRVDGLTTLPRDLAFSSDGTRLAAVIGAESASYADIFDLKTGACLAHVPVPMMRGTFAREHAPAVFLNASYVLLFDGTVVSVDRKAVAFSYRYAQLNSGSAPPPSKLVYLPLEVANARVPLAVGARGSAPVKPPAMSLASTILPHDAALKNFATIKDSDLYVWHPGMTVRLDLTVAGSDDFRNKQLDLWTASLKDHGITVDDKSSNVLRANSFFMQGPPSNYRSGSEQITLARQVVGHEIRLTVGGKEIWTSVYNEPPKNGNGPAVVMFSKKAGESAQQALDRAYPAPTEASAVLLPPELIAIPRDIDAYYLSAHGPAPIPEAGLPQLGIPSPKASRGRGP